jgi:hypothetical protein
MADRLNHLDKNGSREVSDETIRRFLLGCLDDSERPVFEERFFSDEALDRRVRLAELGLADDYAYGRLSDAERALFEEKFLVSADRRRQIEVSNILRERFASAPALKTTFVERLQALPAFSRPVWRYAFGLVILLLMLGSAWLVIKEPRFTERIVNRIAPRRSSQRSAPQDIHHPINSSTPEHSTTPSPMPVHEQVPPSAAFVTAASSGNNVPSVTRPKGEQDVVRVQFAVRLDPAVTYRAELFAADGQSVFSIETLKVVNDKAQVGIDVPARVLKRGSYQIRVSRNQAGTKEDVGSFYFRVE